ncbi:GldG family protein [bacterium]|nr:GldG family protein [bacterium]
MDKIKRNLNYIGLVLIFLALVTLRIWTHIKIIPLILGILGIASIIVYIILNLSLLKQSLKRKSFLYSSNLVLLIVIVLGIVVVLNYLFAQYHHRFDFTKANIHSLSDQSVKVVKNMDQKIRVKCFFRQGNYNRSKMENLMEIYAYHTNKLDYEFIDPDKNPGLVKRYEIKEDGTTVMEMGEKSNRITSTSEEDITNALIKLTRERKKTIYFLEGHGEASIEQSEASGYSLAKKELEKMGYQVEKLTMAFSKKFPEDAALLVVPGPQKGLLPQELETINNYLQKGGRVFFMVDPETSSGLEPFIENLGIQVQNDLIVDTVSRMMGGDYFMPVVNEYETHDITTDFRYATFYPYARSMKKMEEIPEGVSVNVLAKTSPNSWSERELEQKEVSFNKNKDKKGPLSVACVGTIELKTQKEDAEKKEREKKPTPQEALPEKGKKEKGRFVVFGDSDFASNRYYNLSGNGNFFLNTVNWLTEEADLISIQPETSEPRTIRMTPSQGRLLFFVSVIILPLVVLIVGVSVWIRRRSL